MNHVWRAMDEGIQTRAASASRERLLASIDACLMDSEAALASSLARVPGSSGGGDAGGGARHTVPKKTDACPTEAGGGRGGSCDAMARAADRQTEHAFGKGKGDGICEEPRGGHGSLVTYCFADVRCSDGAFAPDVAAREGGRDPGSIQANTQEDEVRFAPVRVSTMSIYAYIHLCIYRCMHVCICIYLGMYGRVCLCAYMDTHNMCAYTCTHKHHIRVLYMHPAIRTCMHDTDGGAARHSKSVHSARAQPHHLRRPHHQPPPPAHRGDARPEPVTPTPVTQSATKRPGSARRGHVTTPVTNPSAEPVSNRPQQR